ncbi:MAG: hypothetical protein N2Z72_07380 [Bacteroidales bacterium]|nr:hypothetical protein [Bacteroidales bacterium]
MIPIYNKTILVSPLPWGLGHVARMIPLLRQYVRHNKVIVFTTQELLDYVKQYVPEIISEVEEETPFLYRKNFSLFHLFFVVFWLQKMYFHERKKVKELVLKHEPDLIISDNRYGWFDETIPSILITHQVRPAFPWWAFPFKPLLMRIMLNKYKHFFQLWIPDVHEYPGLAGKLSHTPVLRRLNHWYIGPLSRFENRRSNVEEEYAVWVLSGPSLHREWMLNQIVSFWKDIDFPLHIVGTEGTIQLPPHIKTYTLTNPAVDELIMNARYLISHTGYSVLMDLEKLNKKGWLFPTSGQSEQIYLAQLHAKKHHVFKNVRTLLECLKLELKKIKQ